MKIMWLKKKLVDVAGWDEDDYYVFSHGTNLLALYDILSSGRLGSDFGRHGGALERVGFFYVTTDRSLAWRYAREASNRTFNLYPDDEVMRISLSDIEDEDDLREKYALVASRLFYETGEPQPPVVLTIEIPAGNKELLEKVYVDEDEFRDWLKTVGEYEEARILQVALRDEEFRDEYEGLLEEVSGSEGTSLEEWLEAETEYGHISQIASKLEEVEGAYLFDVDDVDGEYYPEEAEEVAFHAVAKDIYLALLRLAYLRNDEEAREILRDVARRAVSFYFVEPISLDDIRKLGGRVTATVYLPQREPVVIDLMSADALEKVEKIMGEIVQRNLNILRKLEERSP